jgi:hypothetical protein
MVTRWGGAYNYEDYRIRAWAAKSVSDDLVPQNAMSTYDLRSGDFVVVGFLDGNSREGIILGGLSHQSRETTITEDDIEYISEFNGLEKKIDAEGAYTVTFKGTPINSSALDNPGTVIPAPQYNDQIQGSFYGFDSSGGFQINNNNGVSLNITRDTNGGVMTITSGSSTLVIDSSGSQGITTLTTDELKIETAVNTIINSKQSLKAETLQMSLKGTQVAIGNDSIELIDGLIQLIDGIGSVTVTSPVGTCTPLQASPQWTSSVLPLQIKLKTLKGSL